MLPVLAALLAACGGEGGGAQAAQGPSGEGAAGRGSRGSGPVVVEVRPVESGRISRSVTVSGNIEPIRTVAVNAQLAGALRTVVAEEGTFVQEGAVLATVDDREISAQMGSAEASYQLALGNFQRAERLRERQVITEAEYERDRAALAAAEAQRDQLRTRMGYATVRAPITGVVTEKNVEGGDVVGVQTRLFTIADVSTMVVRVRISELDVVHLRAGQTVDVVLDAFPGRVLIGRIRRVFPTADPQTRLVPVEVAITGSDARVVRTGFLARATFALGAREAVLLVPASAIVKDASGADAVFVVRQDQAERRIVRTGITSEGRVEIVEGVREGELVVVSGTNQLRGMNQTVRVVNGSTPAEPRRLEGGERP